MKKLQAEAKDTDESVMKDVENPYARKDAQDGEQEEQQPLFSESIMPEEQEERQPLFSESIMPEEQEERKHADNANDANDANNDFLAHLGEEYMDDSSMEEEEEEVQHHERRSMKLEEELDATDEIGMSVHDEEARDLDADELDAAKEYEELKDADFADDEADDLSAMKEERLWGQIPKSDDGDEDIGFPEIEGGKEQKQEERSKQVSQVREPRINEDEEVDFPKIADAEEEERLELEKGIVSKMADLRMDDFTEKEKEYYYEHARELFNKAMEEQNRQIRAKYS